MRIRRSLAVDFASLIINAQLLVLKLVFMIIVHCFDLILSNQEPQN